LAIIFAEKKNILSKLVKNHADSKKNFEQALNKILKEHSTAKTVFNKCLTLPNKNWDEALSSFLFNIKSTAMNLYKNYTEFYGYEKDIVI